MKLLKTTQQKPNPMRAAKTITISAKCSDRCYFEILDKEGNSLGNHDGYVPDFMPEDNYGDYIILDIDIDTGKILNWKTPTMAALKKAVKND